MEQPSPRRIRLIAMSGALMVAGALAWICLQAAAGGVSDVELRRRAALSYLDGRRLASIPVEICEARMRLASAALHGERQSLQAAIRSLKAEWKRVHLRQDLPANQPLPRCDTVATGAD